MLILVSKNKKKQRLRQKLFVGFGVAMARKQKRKKDKFSHGVFSESTFYGNLLRRLRQKIVRWFRCGNGNRKHHRKERRKAGKKVSQKTNLQNKSLISAARGTKATHKLTILRSCLSRMQRICLLRYLNLSSASAVPLQCYDLGHARERGYFYS